MSTPRSHRVNPEITYCNADVDVYASEALEPLTNTLGKKIFLNFVGREKKMYGAHFELRSLAKSQRPDLAIRSLPTLIESPPPKPPRPWDNAKRRASNIGFQSGIEPHHREYEVSNAAIIVTIYETDKPSKV